MEKYYYGIPPVPEEIKRVYDFCIIGSGASGAIAADKLVKNGFSVLMLERGPYIKTGVSYDEILRSAELAYARMENGAWAFNGYPWSTCNVGGGTVFYGGVSFRYKEIDFDVSHLLANTGLSLKWPYTYSELSPFYERVEQVLGISGNPIADPFRPYDHYHLPNSPIDYSPQAKILYKAGIKLGLNPFPTPLAILSKDYNGRKKCNNSSPCIEYQCVNDSKSDSLMFLNHLSKNKSLFTIFAGMNAIKLNRNKENNINSVTCTHVVNKEIYEFKAKNFIIACNAIQSARLLLNSRDQWSQKGIGNNHNMVGKTFCQKLSGYVTGYLPSSGRKYSNLNNIGPFSTIAFTDYYISDDFPFKLGGLIYEAKYGFAYTNYQDGLVIRLECMISDIPDKRNSIQVNESDNKVIIDYNPHPLDLIRLNKLMKKAANILKEAGCEEILLESSGFGLGSGHLHGTCRYSNNEKEGVVDANSKVYEVSNLYIIDGSFMPYPGSVNPTLTIQAHALKTVYHLIQINKKG
ncbi:MAG: GMC family oxidoreductase [Rickettsia hoogstraalii]